MSNHEKMKKIITPIDTSLNPKEIMDEIRRRKRKVRQMATQMRVEAEAKKRQAERAKVQGSSTRMKFGV